MGSLFSTPKQRRPARIPDEDDPAVKAARRREFELAQVRSGRASTMLSDSYGGDKLGGKG